MAYTELKLNYLLETKEKIREAIKAKGQNVANSDTFRSYAEKIAAIGGSSDKIILAEQTFEGFASNEAWYGAYTFEFETAPVLIVGESYIVKWDDSEYTCVAQDFSALSAGMVAIGNLANFGGSGNNEPFIINYNASSGGGGILSFDTATSHKVGIYQKTGSAETVYTVTFMSEDGTKELYKRAVVNEDDCADPVKREYISEPTKESTAQYNYTLVGWSASANGALDENILKAVTADKTVYANFAAVLRYYTVTYYDDDGTTVLKTESLAYGATPSYKPTKDGFDFLEWTPKEAVSGEMSYTAVWKAKAAFETATWAEIAAICEAGTAEEYFEVGDKKPVTLTYSDGTSETINFTIVDMGVDTVQGGAATGITVMADNLVKNSTKLVSSMSKSNADIYKDDVFSTYLTTLENAFPSDLMSVVKPVKKYSMNGMLESYKKIFIPTYRNLKGEHGAYNSTSAGYDSYIFPKAQYAYFTQGNSINRTKLNNSTSGDYWTATVYEYRTGSTNYYLMKVVQLNNATSSDVGNATAFGVCPCFCV